MIRRFGSFLIGALAVAASYAATTNTTLTVNATGTIGASGLTATGTATLTGFTAASGNNFTATVPLTPDSSGNLTATMTIGLSDGNLTGTVAVPAAILTGQAVTAKATITGGTGTYAGATGSFPSLTGTGSLTPTGGISLQFTGAGSITTTGGGGGGTGPTAPAITAVLDAGSYTSNIAQGSIFVVKGSNLSAAGFTQLGFPLPTSQSGVKITFTPTAGGAGTDAYLIYLYNQGGVNQLAAVLPSTVSPGTYNVTVTNGTASAPFQVTVVQRKLGLITQDSTGTGLAVVQNYISASQLDVDRFTTGSISGVTISPAKPGQVLIAWATGMGPVTGGDNVASPGFDFNANGVNVQVIVGGVSIKPLYAGRAPGLAGADQINFQLPTNVPTGCTVSFQVSVNGALSNPTFVSIAPDATAGACVAPGFTTAQLQNLDNGGSYTAGGFSLFGFSENVPQFGNATLGIVGGAFKKYTGFQFASAAAASFSSTGSCVVTQGSSQPSAVPAGGIGLDAGKVTLTGPSGSSITNLALTEGADNSYSSFISSIAGFPGGATGNIIAGTYTLNGAGGKDVGAFNASVTIGTPLTITGGLPSTVVRNSGLSLAWTGGNSSDIVVIFGSSGSGNSAVSFLCTTTAGQLGFNVPSTILNQLPAATAASPGSLAVVTAVNPSTGNGAFTAPLTAGGKIDSGFFLALSGTGNAPAYQ